MPSRSELSSAIRSLPVWTEVKKAYKATVPRASKGGTYAKCLKDLMEKGAAGKDAYKKCAEQAKLSESLASIWTD
jgi:hypothetical protein